MERILTINPLIESLRKAGFIGKIVLGGYQISYSTKEELRYKYSEVDIFIFGYTEKFLLESIFIDKPENPLYLHSVCISNEIGCGSFETTPGVQQSESSDRFCGPIVELAHHPFQVASLSARGIGGPG